MGITGLYAELGPGERISLAKLADDHLRSTGAPLRIAIDVSIWSFQAQAAQGGTNPALRTLYYRLSRLLTLPILPIFIFDGPARPQFKRHRKTANVPAYITSRQKTLISLFGYPYHTAPGEAEAECAHLQKLRIVDATLSEDVDALMFGCGKVLRNWSSESGRARGVPTHATVYELDKVEKESGLTPEGMIMVALMSGGDYIPSGIPGCGIRIAVDAARAGFGRELCALGGGAMKRG
ncbi:PIN domain-like protein [Terfezia claveryi]|nr:PIN domain-like protein [Terfezia claveryi]